MSEARPAILALGTSSGFQRDARFTAPAESHAPPRPPEPEDPLALAWAEGFAAGRDEAQAEAAAALAEERDARDALSLSFARLDARLEEELRLRLRETVAALCEATLAPLALDEDALLGRIERAAAMLARADDERVIRLHPDDIRLLSGRMLAEWDVRPDPALARGALRVESATGGIEDGPEQWRLAIAEALHQC